MSQLFILRHGNTFDTGDIVRRIGARTDLPLSRSGRHQTDALGHWLANKLSEEMPEIIAGPLLRTRETAELVAIALGVAPKIRIEEQLREIDYGPDEGQAEEKVRERLGVDALERWEADGIAPDGWHVDADGLTAFWQAQFATAPDRAQVYVTSAGVARFALSAIGAPMQKLRTGAAGLVEVVDGVPNLRFWDQRPGEN